MAAIAPSVSPISLTQEVTCAPLIPLLKTKLGLSNALAGTLATFLRSSAPVQPFIGYWADRTNPRWLVVLAPGGTALFMSLLGASPTYLLTVPLLVLAGLSHAAYHAPAPAMVAHVSGERVGTGMSLFMTLPFALLLPARPLHAQPPAA